MQLVFVFPYKKKGHLGPILPVGVTQPSYYAFRTKRRKNNISKSLSKKKGPKLIILLKKFPLVTLKRCKLPRSDLHLRSQTPDSSGDKDQKKSQGHPNQKNKRLKKKKNEELFPWSARPPFALPWNRCMCVPSPTS